MKKIASVFKYLFNFFIFLSLLHLSKKVEAQTYNFSNLTVESGLSQPQVLSIFQDDRGVMWFGTNGGGITKYDGNTYEYITDKNGLPDNVIYAITKDKKGRILIGTNNGLSVFDGKNYKNYTTQNGLSHNRIFTIFFDKKNNTLLGTGKGVSVFKDSVCTEYNIDEALNNAAIFNISEDTKQNIWYSTIGSGAFKYDGKATTNYRAKEGLKTDYVYSIVEKSENNYWFLTDEGIYELKDDAINRIKYANLPGDAAYYSYLKDSNNNIWLACSAGVIKLAGGKLQLFTQSNGLVNNNIWKIFQDREGNLWFASRENGISKLGSESFYMYTVNDSLLSNTVGCIFQSKDGQYYIGSGKGLTVFHKKSATNYTQKDWKYNSKVTIITQDKNGTILIGTSYGILRYNGKIFERIETDGYKRGLNYIHDIFIDSKGNTWLGTKLGLAKISNNTIKEHDQKGLPQNVVYKIFEDTNGSYWFGADDGLYRYDGVKVYHYSEKDGFTTKAVVNIVKDQTNNLWFATSAGLYKYSEGKFSIITEKDGLASNIIQSIAIDKKGNIWVGLLNGIDNILIDKDGAYKIHHYGIEDGFIGEVCVLNSILIDKEQNIWFGAEKGLMVYQPQYDRRNELEAITSIKSINLFGQKQNWKYFADSLDQNNLPIDLKLGHDRNYLTFNFVGVSLTAPAKVRYKYMLKGLDKDWLPQTAKTEAIYSNIPPGNYEFLVIANNGDGVWNKQPASFKFTIAPPFWQTWWFYSIIACVILSGIFSYVKIKSANIKIIKQNRIIEEKNAELKQAYVQIAGKNKSITDSINYAQRIQHSFLTSENLLNYCLKDFFILYKPRDIVSGDFYWAFDLPDRTLVACADSTGHGIPGAFMSLIGISLLNEISHSKKMVEPASMLDELRRIIICALNPEQADDGGKDGMDIALISIFKSSDPDTVKIHFAGANNTIYLISEQNDTKELTEFKGDKQPVGFYSSMKPFKQHEIIAKKGDIIYMHTDGFADQFGGQKAKKFMSKQLKNTLLAISDLPQKRQQELLDRTFLEWKGELEQVDDVTVIGIKLGSKSPNVANPHKIYSEQPFKESIQCQTIEELF